MFWVTPRPGSIQVFGWTGSNFSTFQSEWEAQGFGYTATDNGDGTVTLQPTGATLTPGQWTLPGSPSGRSAEDIFDQYQMLDTGDKNSFVIKSD